MGAVCSDPGRRPGLQDLRYAANAPLDFNEELSDLDSGPCSERSCTPLVKKVPISVNHLRVYRVETKKRECFFDLDSVDEGCEASEKAMSDITFQTYKFNPNKPARLTKANLSIRDSKRYRKQSSVPIMPVHGQSPRWNGRLTLSRSVCSDQPRWKNSLPRSVCSVCSDRAVSPGYMEKGSGKCIRVAPWGYSTDERGMSPFNAYVEPDEKSESESDSLKFPETRTESRKSLSRQAIEDMPERTISLGTKLCFKVNKLKPGSPDTSDTDRTSFRNSSSPAGTVHDQLQPGVSSFPYPAPKEQTEKRDSNLVEINQDYSPARKVAMLICENTDNEIGLYTQTSQHMLVTDEMNNEDTGTGGLIFTTPATEDILSKSWPETDCAQRNNRHVVLP